MRLPDNWEGHAAEAASEFNLLVAQCNRMSVQLRDASSELASQTPGHVGQRLSVDALGGFWLEHAANVNAIIQRGEPATERAKTILLALNALKNGERTGLPLTTMRVVRVPSRILQSACTRARTRPYANS